MLEKYCTQNLIDVSAIAAWTVIPVVSFAAVYGFSSAAQAEDTMHYDYIVSVAGPEGDILNEAISDSKVDLVHDWNTGIQTAQFTDKETGQDLSWEAASIHVQKVPDKSFTP